MSKGMNRIHVRIVVGGVILLLAAVLWFVGLSGGLR
jgi:hypothetical protein